MTVRDRIAGILRPYRSGTVGLGLVVVMVMVSLIGLAAWHWSADNDGASGSPSPAPGPVAPGDRAPVEPVTVAEPEVTSQYPSWFAPHPGRQLIIAAEVDEVSATASTWRATYTLRLAPTDPLVMKFRDGTWAGGPDLIMEDLLGEVRIYPSDRAATVGDYAGPHVRVIPDSGVVRVTWDTSGEPLVMTGATVAVVSYAAPFRPLPVESAELAVAGRRFTVSGLSPPSPVIRQDERSVDVPIGTTARTRVALLQDGYTTDSDEIRGLLAETEHADRTDHPVRGPIADDWLVVLLTAMIPWLLVLAAPVRRGTIASWIRAFAATAAPALVPASLFARSDDHTVGPVNAVAVLVPLVVVLARQARDGMRRWRWYHVAAILAFAVGWLAWCVHEQWPVAVTPAWWVLGVTVAAGVAVVSRLSGARVAGGAAAAAALTLAAGVTSAGHHTSWFSPAAVLVTVFIGAWLLAAATVAAELSGYGLSRSDGTIVAATVFGLLAVVPVDRIDAPSGALSVPAYSIPRACAGAALLLMALLAELLAREGGSSAALANPAVRSYGVALAAIPLVSPPAAVRVLVGDWALLISTAVLVGGLYWLMPDDQRRLATSLGRLSPSAHAAMLRRQLHCRAELSGARARYRTAATGDVDRADADRRRRALDEAERQVRRPGALAGGGGLPPWINGMAGARYALALALPVMIGSSSYAAAASNSSLYFNSTGSALDALLIGLFWVRWGIYGFVFGYFYPLLRGREPMTKALLFATVVLLAETIGVFGGLGGKGTPEVIEAVGTIIAPGVILTVGLGLLWERRLAVRAGIPWRRVRAWNGVRALSVPAVSIAVAVVSSAASSFLSLWLDRLGKR